MEKKLDPRTTSCRFVGYSEKSKGLKFYCPNNHSRIMETHNARFLEHLDGDDEDNSHLTSQSFEELPQRCEFPEQQATEVCIPFEPQYFPPIDSLSEQEEQSINEQQATPHNEEQGLNTEDLEQDNGTAAAPIQEPIRKSQRVRKPVTLPDFVYLNEAEYNVGDEDDPTSYHQAISSTRSTLWNEVMHEELQSMDLSTKTDGGSQTRGLQMGF